MSSLDSIQLSEERILLGARARPIPPPLHRCTNVLPNHILRLGPTSWTRKRFPRVLVLDDIQRALGPAQPEVGAIETRMPKLPQKSNSQMGVRACPQQSPDNPSSWRREK